MGKDNLAITISFCSIPTFRPLRSGSVSWAFEASITSHSVRYFETSRYGSLYETLGQQIRRTQAPLSLHSSVPFPSVRIPWICLYETRKHDSPGNTLHMFFVFAFSVPRAYCSFVPSTY